MCTHPLCPVERDYTGTALPERLARLAENMQASAAANGGLDWLDDAACGDADPALLVGPANRMPAEMLALCSACPVLAHCQRHAAASEHLLAHTTIAGTTGNARYRAARAGLQGTALVAAARCP